MTNIVMVEDDEELASIIKRYLSSYDFKVTNYTNGLSLLKALDPKYELLILDLTLPDIDGLELLTKIRKISSIPIIISSARDDLLDKIMGLERGADDYLAKPYDPRELEARIKSILRRKGDIVIKKDEVFKVDENQHIIFFKNNPLDLTLAQYDILSTLIERNNGVVSREELIETSQHIDDYSTLKNIDVLISHIRKKIALYDEKKYIHSVRGLGYKLLR